ncbi:MAG: chorismate-binding protein, partial [Firmicutes bacterium]|nr:chorismate-binding protein [Bacillota bacterium]
MPHHLPEFETFERLAGLPAEQGGGNLIPLYRRLFSDALTPVLAYRRLVRPDQRMAPSFLLESVIGGDRAGRDSYLGTQPMLELVARGCDMELRDHHVAERSLTFVSEDPLSEMPRITQDLRLAKVEGLPDFTGGWVGFAAYDAVRYLEREKLSDPPRDDRGLPDLHFQLYNDVVAFDHVQKSVLAITHVRVDEYASIKAAYEAGEAQLDALVDRLVHAASTPSDDPLELPPGHVDLAAPPPQLPESNMKAGGYQEAVRRCKQYIAVGDAFQIVPSQRFDVPTAADPFDIYRALRVVNPSPYMFYLQIDGG